MSLAQAVELAAGLMEDNQLTRAESVLAAVLEAAPHSADALHFIGLIRAQQERGDEAVELIRKAVAAAPAYAEAHYNLGNILHALGRRDEAHAAFVRTIELRPDLAEAHLAMAELLRRWGQRAEAVPFYQRALELEPTLAGAHCQLGRTYYRLGQINEAAAAFAAWLRIDPDNPVARHMAAAIGAAATPMRASDGYVRGEFDAFADTFEDVMRELRYDAPQHIAAALGAQIQPMRELDVFDAGCGTGLCGAAVQPWARRLVGVDLSAEMIDRARQRGVYDELIVAELTHFVQTTSQTFDLVVSADTFIYFGALSAVFHGIARCLRIGGTFAFSVEYFQQETRDRSFFLHPHGRYSHGENYVRRCLAEAGLTMVALTPKAIRLELKEPVGGLIVVAVKLPATEI